MLSREERKQILEKFLTPLFNRLYEEAIHRYETRDSFTTWSIYGYLQRRLWDEMKKDLGPLALDLLSSTEEDEDDVVGWLKSKTWRLAERVYRELRKDVCALIDDERLREKGYDPVLIRQFYACPVERPEPEGEKKESKEEKPRDNESRA